MPFLARIRPRGLAFAAVVNFVVLLASALTVPCRTYDWIAAATLIPFAFIAIAVVGTRATRPDISDRVRGFTVFIALCAIVGGSVGALGVMC